MSALVEAMRGEDKEREEEKKERETARQTEKRRVDVSEDGRQTCGI